MGLEAMREEPGLSVPHPGPKAEPSCPGSGAGKTQEKPKRQFPTLRAWVIAAGLLSRNRAKR
jgi:hypothetical protein